MTHQVTPLNQYLYSYHSLEPRGLKICEQHPRCNKVRQAVDSGFLSHTFMSIILSNNLYCLFLSLKTVSEAIHYIDISSYLAWPATAPPECSI